MVKPRLVEPQGPPLSAKGPFVKFDPVDSMICGNNHKKPHDNYIIDDVLDLRTYMQVFVLSFAAK